MEKLSNFGLDQVSLKKREQLWLSDLTLAEMKYRQASQLDPQYADLNPAEREELIAQRRKEAFEFLEDVRRDYQTRLSGLDTVISRDLYNRLEVLFNRLKRSMPA